MILWLKYKDHTELSRKWLTYIGHRIFQFGDDFTNETQIEVLLSFQNDLTPVKYQFDPIDELVIPEILRISKPKLWKKFKRPL